MRGRLTSSTTRAFAHVVRGAKFASNHAPPQNLGLTVNALNFQPHGEIDFYTPRKSLALKMLISWTRIL